MPDVDGIAAHAPSRARGPAALPALTGREADVPQLVAGGLSNAEIATELHLSRETVKTLVSSVLIKLGARDRHPGRHRRLRERVHGYTGPQSTTPEGGERR